jgi:hypothetical protein
MLNSTPETQTSVNDRNPVNDGHTTHDTAPLPIFATSQKGLQNPRRVHQAKIGALSIPLTEEEFRALIARLNQHTEKNGVKYGFFSAVERAAREL